MTIRRIHIVYPHGDVAATPDAIGRELGNRLGRRFDVVFHDWAGFESIPPSRDAALVGHAHPVPGTTFRRSARRPGWGRRVLLQPFVTELDQIGYVAGVVPHVDRFVAICGTHWADALPNSALRSIAPVFTQLDLAIDGRDFPVLVGAGRPPGQRSLLYIGRDVPMKNLDYLEEIARRRPSWRVARIGPPGRDRRAIEALGPLDFRTGSAQELLSSFDFLVTVGRADANPTTVLEAMAWGLVPVCTPQSGYEGYEGITNIPIGDVDGAVFVLDRLQAAPQEDLAARRRANRQLIEEHYTWDRFAAVVEAAICDESARSASVSVVTQVWATGRWWATAPASSNRAGLRQAFANLVRRS